MKKDSTSLFREISDRAEKEDIQLELIKGDETQRFFYTETLEDSFFPAVVFDSDRGEKAYIKSLPDRIEVRDKSNTVVNFSLVGLLKNVQDLVQGEVSELLPGNGFSETSRWKIVFSNR